jgi:hypothetical protein
MARPDRPILDYATPASANLIRLVTALACAVFFNALTLLVSAAARDAAVALNRSVVASALFWIACAIYLALTRGRPSANAAFLIAYGFIPWVALVQFGAEILHVPPHLFGPDYLIN